MELTQAQLIAPWAEVRIERDALRCIALFSCTAMVRILEPREPGSLS